MLLSIVLLVAALAILAFPISPSIGKGSKVFMTSGDGVQLVAEPMTKQTNYELGGVIYNNLVYLLGIGRTLINMRPALEPRVDIDSIISGGSASATTNNDEVALSSLSMLVNNVLVTAAAATKSSIPRPATGEGAWLAISVNKSTGAFTCTKGADTTGTAGVGGLLSTWGSGAGQKPFIPVTDLLVCTYKLDSTSAPLANSGFIYTEKETPVSAAVLPNIGGCKLNSELLACHAGALSREVKFNGYYQDSVLSEIISAKNWSTSDNQSSISETTLSGGYSQTVTSGMNFSYEQLATDPIAKDNRMKRQGHCGIRLLFSNGGGFQGAATISTNFSAQPTAFQSISVSGSMSQDPIEV